MRKKNYKGVKYTKRYVEKCEDVCKTYSDCEDVFEEYYHKKK